MKNPWKKLLYALLTMIGLLAAVAALALGGCRQIIYPLARAFGSPPEAELARCRIAFEQYRTKLEASRVLVVPVYFIPDLKNSDRQWRSDLAAALVRAAGPRTKARFEVAVMAPQIKATHFGHNQMRYLWERSEAYATWIKATPPGADYVWCVEIFGFNGKVVAIQLYAFEAKGQLAYCRLFNSHQFGDNLWLNDEASIQLVVNTLLEALRLEPEAVFPPYGVG
jgi:hypothetical protein